jgi:hypothetical protein
VQNNLEDSLLFDTIRTYITKNEPFGPTNSADIDAKDVDVMNRLFERHNWVYENLHQRPSIIIGRKGSGKTYYLQTVLFDKQYDFYIEIRTAYLLSHISSLVEGIITDSVFPETLAELWEASLWTCVLSEACRHPLLLPKDLTVVSAYLEKVGVQDSNTVDDVLWKLANLFDEVLKSNPRNSVTEVLRRFDHVAFDDAKTVVVNGLRSSKKSFVILMDSLDDFRLDIDSVSRSLQGLLKLVGSMNKPRDVLDIRLCLPSELFHQLIRISSNPNNDFRRALRIQWTATELILIGAQRLMYYLAMCYPGFVKTLDPLDLTKRGDVLTLFSKVLPEKITNQAGFQEETMSYILRHTQLLPRHFLMLLNSIFKGLQGPNPFPIPQEKIISDIHKVEEFIVGDVFVAFKLIHPTAEITCKRCLPELGHKFSVGQLHQIFTRHGKAVFGGEGMEEFQRMLIEIGALGRVIPGKKTDIYIRGNFEYTVARELTISPDDELCIHPLFSGIFRNDGRKDRPVYPYGTALDEDEYRQISSKQTNNHAQKVAIYPLKPNIIKKKMRQKIFISYRRIDSADVAGRIYDRLVQAFDKKSVFKDVDSIPVGLDFRDVLDDAVKKCDVFLVVIGSQWLELKNADGNRRLDDPKDFVRTEIELALKRKIPVIPILVQGAFMPPANKLPRVIRELAYRNGLQVRSDPDFHKDMDRLISKL